MGQTPSKAPASGHHRGRPSNGGGSTSHAGQGLARASSTKNKDGKGTVSRGSAVPPSETLVSATATPTRRPAVPSSSNTPSASPQNIDTPLRPKAAGLDKPSSTESRSLPISTPTKPSSPPPMPDNRPPQSYGGFDPHRASTAAPSLLRPPRLPLPVEEELHTPGSPILSPTDFKSAEPDVEPDEDEPTSEMGMYQLDSGGDVLVPTLIEWKEPGEKVYVTGTFTGWSKKFRLRSDVARKSLSAIIKLPPGTHHVKFIVDGDPQIAPHLPTAVDFTNILVNYIEVSADHAPPRQPTTLPPVSKPIQTDVPIRQLPPHSSQTSPLHEPPTQPPQPQQQDEQPAPKLTLTGPSRPTSFNTKIPSYLRGMESADNLSSYSGDMADFSKETPAPSLPIMLSKVILNSSTPVKDDSSVLNIPNHVVLNHLATSSIRFGCLASSATTRYRRKFVTTIMYKPVREEASPAS